MKKINKICYCDTIECRDLEPVVYDWGSDRAEFRLCPDLCKKCGGLIALPTRELERALLHGFKPEKFIHDQLSEISVATRSASSIRASKRSNNKTSKKKNPKKMGSAFERDICRLLSAWILGKDIRSDEEIKNTKLVVWRIGSSGAMFTINNEQVNLHGDVAPIDDIAVPILRKFNFELKRRKNFNLFSVLSSESKKQELLSWFEQACINTYYPILIVKIIHINKYGYGIIDRNTLHDLTEYCGRCPEYIKISFQDKTLYVFEIIRFLEWLTPYKDMLLNFGDCKEKTE